MAWTELTRRQYRRDDLRYASNLTDDEWSLIKPFLSGAARLGRPRSVDLRTIMNAILFMATTGCQWRQIPKEFAPFTTIQGYFYRWSRDGTLRRINHALVMVAREQAGREPTPSVGVIDSQSVKTTEAGGPRGFDAGKKIKGRKRHIITDMRGHLVGIDVHPADIQDRDGAVRVIKEIRSLDPWLRHLFADGGYAGPKLADAGEAVYRGRRQLGEGREVLLFDRDGETLVKNAMSAQAARASTMRIGDTLEVDARGRMHEHQPQPEKPQGQER